MIKVIKIFVVFIFLTVCISCEKVEKDVKSYSPKVETKNVEIKEDGTVLVSYDIVSNGLSELEWVGCSVDTVENPSVESMQKLASFIDGNTYYSVYSVQDFDVSKKYYFRPFANNLYGLSFGSNFELDSIVAPPVIVPCTLQANKFNFQGATYQYYYTGHISSSGYRVVGNSSSADVYFDFYEEPIEGVYTTISDLTPESRNEVSVRVVKFNTYYVLPDAKVYVRELDPITFEITICDGETEYGSGTSPFFTRLVFSK